jgi:hypothetical protein
MSIAPDGALWIATGDGTTGSGTYVGAGVYRLASPDTASFTSATARTGKIGGTELDSQVIRRILIDAANSRVFVAGSRGLYAHSLTPSSTAWTRVLAPCATGLTSCTDVNVNYRDLTNDVVVQPGTNGKVIVANVAWRSGAAYNGFYQSTDGGNSWAKINPLGAINPKDVGNATMQYSADGSRLYVVLESPAVQPDRQPQRAGPERIRRAQAVDRCGLPARRPGLVQPVRRCGPEQRPARLRRPRRGLRELERRFHLVGHRSLLELRAVLLELPGQRQHV